MFEVRMHPLIPILFGCFSYYCRLLGDHAHISALVLYTWQEAYLLANTLACFLILETKKPRFDSWWCGRFSFSAGILLWCFYIFGSWQSWLLQWSPGFLNAQVDPSLRVMITYSVHDNMHQHPATCICSRNIHTGRESSITTFWWRS